MTTVLPEKLARPLYRPQRDILKRFQTAFHRVIEMLGDHRCGRELLFRKLALHVLLQHPAGVKRQSPQARQKDEQGRQGDSCLEGIPNIN